MTIVPGGSLAWNVEQSAKRCTENRGAGRDSVLADMTHTPLMEVSPDEVPLMQSPCGKKVPTPALDRRELRWG
jgi:hypothetical protein